MAPDEFSRGRKFRLEILYTPNRAKGSFCSDGTDNRMNFVKFGSVLSSYYAQNAS